jgi:anthranilate/para-aminobenzoate synthase component I
MSTTAPHPFLTHERPAPLVRMLSVQNASDEFDVYDYYRRLARTGRPSFLLESGKGSQTIARYSFFGTDPYLVLRGKGDRYSIRRDGRTLTSQGDGFAVLADLLRGSRLPRPPGLPPFFGGAVGFFSYDLVRRFERLPSIATDDPAWPDLEFAFFDLLAALDRETGTCYLLFSPPLSRLLSEPRDKLYREGCDRLAELEARLTGTRTPTAIDDAIGRMSVSPEQSRRDYIERVRQCQEYIRSGDIYQANLSHRFNLDLQHPGTEFGAALYGRLRRINPSPFSALLVFDDLTVVSSSPERLVCLDGRRAQTRPIAGTRGRGCTQSDDQRLADELLGNSKERAEHLMLVDLERNDLGRVCRYGTVQVDEFMAVERYSHVSHLVSNVTGDLHDGADGFDLVRAVFPGGTITGVPKIRCMEIIEGLEPVRRGPYTGSLGYLSWSGDLDLNIIIRSFVLTGSRGYLQVGAGIVADSDPGREFEETMLKAGALMQAVGQTKALHA